jgi:hypothetical protein
MQPEAFSVYPISGECLRFDCGDRETSFGAALFSRARQQVQETVCGYLLRELRDLSERN